MEHRCKRTAGLVRRASDAFTSDVDARVAPLNDQATDMIGPIAQEDRPTVLREALLAGGPTAL